MPSQALKFSAVLDIYAAARDPTKISNSMRHCPVLW